MMERLLLIVTLVAVGALAALWLWTRPDVRAWLAGHWDRAWQAVEPHVGRVWQVVKPHQARLAVATFGLAIITAQITSGFWAVVPLAITAAVVWFARQAARESGKADRAAQAAELQVASLAAAANRIAATRDAYADALNDVLASGDLDTAQARARTALENRSYAGDLAVARAGHEAAELELKDAKAELADTRAWACTCGEPREVAG